eukprot:415216-Hanusia_phi.AAC.1
MIYARAIRSWHDAPANLKLALHAPRRGGGQSKSDIIPGPGAAGILGYYGGHAHGHRTVTVTAAGPGPARRAGGPGGPASTVRLSGCAIRRDAKF